VCQGWLSIGLCVVVIVVWCCCYLCVTLCDPNPLQVGCKVLHFFHMYMLGCNYFWMLCEGIYLHTLIVVAVLPPRLG
jgi:hypothetical protein